MSTAPSDRRSGDDQTAAQGRNMPARDGRYRLAYWLILSLALAVRLVGLDKGFWLDEGYTLEVIHATPFMDALARSDHPPAYFLILKLFAMVSERDSWLRFPSVLMGTATVGLMMTWLARHSRPAGLIVGALLIFQPMMVRYAQEVRDYALLLFLTVAMLWQTDRRPSDAGRVRLVGFFLLGMALVATHAIGLVISAAGSFHTLVTRRGSKDGWRLALAISLGAVFGYALIFGLFLHADKRVVDWWMPPFSWRLLLEQSALVVAAPELHHTLTHAIATVSPSLALSGAMALWIGGGLVLIVAAWREAWALFLTIVVFVVLVIAISLFYLPILWYRTLLPALPLLAAGLSFGLARLLQERWRFAGWAGLVALVGLEGHAWTKFHAGRAWEEWREAADFLDRAVTAGELVWAREGAEALLVKRYSQAARAGLETYARPQVLPVDFGSGEVTQWAIVRIASKEDLDSLRNYCYGRGEAASSCRLRLFQGVAVLSARGRQI